MPSRIPKDVRTGNFVADARWQLIERIVASSALQKSFRLRDLLLYLTERTLKSQEQDLTEHQIGQVVFGKPADYSPLDDSSVRVHVRQLRLKLHEYFDSEGQSEPLIVEIPKGSYIPVFRERPALPAPEAPPPAVGRKPVSLPVGWVAAAALAVVCVVLIIRLAGMPSRGASAVERAPWPLSLVVDGDHRTLIVVSDVNFGMLRIISGKAGSLDEYLSPDFPRSFEPQRPSEEMSSIMGYISKSLLTSYADVAVLTSLLNMTGSYRERISIRSARDLRLRDLEEGHYIFLGSPGSNPWVSLFENKMNFCEREDGVGKGPKFFINKKPRPGEEKVYQGLQWTGTSGEDYASIAVLPTGQYKGNALILQGLQQEGTEAAGLFLSDETNRRQLRDAIGIGSGQGAPVHFEVLLRTKAIAGATNSTSIVAARRIE